MGKRGRRKANQRNERSGWIARLAILASIATVIGTGVGVASYMDSRRDSGKVDQTESPSKSPEATATDDVPSPTPTPTKVEIGSQVGLGCPSYSILDEPSDTIEVCVVRWCFADAPRSQGQLKMKVRIDNRQQVPLDIGLDPPTTLRLLVLPVEGELQVWSPPSPTGDAPTQVEYQETMVWAIPPNGDGDAELVGPGAATFATHWDGNVLAPGERYFRPENRKGDLVFYVPLKNGDANSVKLVGFAIVRGTEVLAATPPHEWGPRVEPNAF